MLHHELYVTTWPITQPLRKILVGNCWALAYALRRPLSCRCRLFTPPLPKTSLLFTPPLLATSAGPITLARLPTPPAPSRLPATTAAIAGLRMGRPEMPFTTFEETASLATRVTCLLPCATNMLQ